MNKHPAFPRRTSCCLRSRSRWGSGVVWPATSSPATAPIGSGPGGRRRPQHLNLILPEVYLEEDDVDARISPSMRPWTDYTQNVLTRAVDGFIYVERTEQSGRVRQGLVGKDRPGSIQLCPGCGACHPPQ